MRSTRTVEQACANWLAGRHGLRMSAKAAYRNGLQPLRDRCGDMPIQALEKRHLDELVTDLMAGGVVPVHVKEGRGVRGRYRRPWKATTINPMLNYLESMLNELLKQGKVNYNVAALVDRLPVSKVPMQTFTTVEVEKLLGTFAEDRLGHVWHLALVGLRRGELCGLRWTDIDFKAQTISIEITRVVVDGKVVEGDTKSDTSTRVLPLTPELLAALRAAMRMQAEEQLAAGPPHLRAPIPRSLCAPTCTTNRRSSPSRPRASRRGRGVRSPHSRESDLRFRTSSPVRESKAVLGPVFSCRAWAEVTISAAQRDGKKSS